LAGYLNVRPLFGDLDGFDQEGIVGAGARKAFWPRDCASSHEGCERNNRGETKEARGRKRSLRSGLGEGCLGEGCQTWFLVLC